MPPGNKLVLVLGSVRQGRMVDRVSQYVAKAASESTKMSTVILDPQELDPDCGLSRQPLHFLQNPKEAPQWMLKTHEIIKDASGLIMLSSEYNGNVPPALLNVLNAIPPPTFRHKPVGIVTYTMGTTGAMRALTMLRPFLCELGMICVPGYVPIPLVHEIVDEKGNCHNELVRGNLRKLLTNVEWYCQAIESQKKSSQPPE